MKTAVFVDINNVYHNVLHRYGTRVDYDKYVNHLKDLFPDIRWMFAYASKACSSRFLYHLKRLGFECLHMSPVDWTLRAIEISERADQMIFSTADPIFQPLIPWLKTRGIAVKIIACNIPTELDQVPCTEITRELLYHETVNPTE